MKFNIPRVGQVYQLIDSVAVNIHPEGRNEGFLRTRGYKLHYYVSYLLKNGYPNYEVEENWITPLDAPDLPGRRFKTKQEFLDYREKYKPHIGPIKLVLPEGSYLNVDRIYIRKSHKLNEPSDFDSITFRISENPVFSKSFGGSKTAPRFWVKLDEANEFNVEKYTK